MSLFSGGGGGVDEPSWLGGASPFGGFRECGTPEIEACLRAELREAMRSLSARDRLAVGAGAAEVGRELRNCRIVLRRWAWVSPAVRAMLWREKRR